MRRQRKRRLGSALRVAPQPAMENTKASANGDGTGFAAPAL